jgi:hypothetical protein
MPRRLLSEREVFPYQITLENRILCCDKTNKPVLRLGLPHQ